jgi:hypothetical protein
MTTPTSEPTHQRLENTHRTIYLVALALFIGLVVWGLVAFEHHPRSDRAEAMATELAERFSAGGLGAIDVDATARVLGTDGGAVCADPAAALERGELSRQIVSGAAGPGTRPIIGGQNLVAGERLVIEVYCPEHLSDFDAAVADLNLVDEE